MNALILNCSCGMEIYLIKEGSEQSFCDETQNRHSDDLLLKIDEMLKNNKLNISDIDVFGVCIGPGSFTGIRVAVSMIKGFCVAGNKKIISISNFDIYECVGSKYVLVLQGYSKFVYARFFDGKESQDMCVEIDKLVQKIKAFGGDTVIYAQNEKVQNCLKNFEIRAQIPQKNVFLCFNNKFQSDDFTPINQITPTYLRASQAEIEREKKGK